ncbi:unnamed protein product, partial [Ectocarpus sp. 12 AP-2014]
MSANARTLRYILFASPNFKEHLAKNSKTSVVPTRNLPVTQNASWFSPATTSRPQERRKRQHRHPKYLFIHHSAQVNIYHGATSAPLPGTSGTTPLPVSWDTAPPRCCQFQPRLTGDKKMWWNCSAHNLCLPTASAATCHNRFP